jgi:diadenosine tetraphosphate (Ap4A) HIT family hydrolase
VNYGVAMRDIDIELIQRVAAEVFEILLHLHFHIVPR